MVFESSVGRGVGRGGEEKILSKAYYFNTMPKKHICVLIYIIAHFFAIINPHDKKFYDFITKFSGGDAHYLFVLTEAFDKMQKILNRLAEKRFIEQKSP